MVEDGGDSVSSPTPPLEVEAFKKLVAVQGKKQTISATFPKFVKRLENIPWVALPCDAPYRSTLSLEEKGLVSHFSGLCPSPNSTKV